MAEVKKLYRDVKNGKIAGVCAGIASYFSIDVIIVRILAIVLLFWGGAGLVAYIAGWIIIPIKPEK